MQGFSEVWDQSKNKSHRITKFWRLGNFGFNKSIGFSKNNNIHQGLLVYGLVFIARLHFKVQDNPGILDRVFWSYETCFHNNAVLGKHNAFFS